jgi:hypothetical protein
MRFDASDFNLMIAGERVRMGTIVQWPLKESDLKFTIPEDLAPEIGNLLAAAKSNPNIFSNSNAKAIIECWELSMCESQTEGMSGLTLLRHRAMGVSCAIANFPLPCAPLPKPEDLVQEFQGFRIGEYVEVEDEEDDEGNVTGWVRGTIQFFDASGGAYVHADGEPANEMLLCPMECVRHIVDPITPKPIAKVADAPQISEEPQPQPQVEESPIRRRKTASSGHARTASFSALSSEVSQPQPQVNNEVASDPNVPQLPPPQQLHKTTF